MKRVSYQDLREHTPLRLAFGPNTVEASYLPAHVCIRLRHCAQLLLTEPELNKRLKAAEQTVEVPDSWIARTTAHSILSTCQNVCIDIYCLDASLDAAIWGSRLAKLRRDAWLSNSCLRIWLHAQASPDHPTVQRWARYSD